MYLEWYWIAIICWLAYRVGYNGCKQDMIRRVEDGLSEFYDKK